MGDSYRIRTEVGVNHTINLQLNQDFEFLEILSLKIQQTEIYNRNCADYGVLVGRVTANNGFGIPNARVSLFIPVSSIDESNSTIQSIYPYKSPSDKNEDGYRYNLLPYEKSYEKHAATGTFPSRNDVLTATTASEIYDKYFKFTAKTNESGDYMIFGLPLGFQRVVMDVDLSDIGEFSLTPQDLIRMGMATESQVAGDTFKTSTDLNSLPQIINIVKSCEIAPLWGDPTLCQIAVNRVDFDLRDDANIDIQPTAVFMGSIFSSVEKERVRPARQILGFNTSLSNRIKDNLGNLCELVSGPGQILAIRQTINQDVNGNPVLEQYRLEQSGNIILDDGTWLTELPMNLDYLITNEFGQKVISNDPTKGIPTKGKYRFKIKWGQARTINQQTRRPYYLVPNVKEYGWANGVDPTISLNPVNIAKQQSSYHFGLDWTGYTQGFIGQERLDRLNEMINCEDSFYEFNFNRVYTVASFIDQVKNGGRGQFIGIKEVQDSSCANTINKFPVNDGFRNFDLIYFIFSLLMYVVQTILVYVLYAAHISLFVYNLFVSVFCWALPRGCNKIDYSVRLPMITYPDCEACDCKDQNGNKKYGVSGTNGVLTYLSEPTRYYDALVTYFDEKRLAAEYRRSNQDGWANIVSEALAGNPQLGNVKLGKLPESDMYPYEGSDTTWSAESRDLPTGEAINIFNLRDKFFKNVNKIKVTFDYESNVGKFHYDNTITVLTWKKFAVGDMLTTVNPDTTSDINNLYSARTEEGLTTVIDGNQSFVKATDGRQEDIITTGIPGFTVSGPQSITVTYAATDNSNVTPGVQYYLSTGSTIGTQQYPMDREYFQVIHTMTVAEYKSMTKWVDFQQKESFSYILRDRSQANIPQVLTEVEVRKEGNPDTEDYFYLNPTEFYEDFDQQYILILQRGVDPYSPLYKNKYDLSILFGIDTSVSIQKPFEVTGYTRLNIPIQARKPSAYTQDNTMYPSYFFTPGITFCAFTSNSVGYYGSLNTGSEVILDDDDYLQQLPNGAMVSQSINRFYASGNIPGRFYPIEILKYNSSEDLRGGSFMAGITDRENYYYFSQVSYRVEMQFTNPQLNVMRLDRLPSSDSLNGKSWLTNPALLQQNNNFALYIIESEAGTQLDDLVVPGNTTGAGQVPPDIDGLPDAIKVFDTFGCDNMVSLQCYEGTGADFKINQNCIEKDAVENGCYVFMKRPLFDLGKDIRTLGEWGYRFRFFYGLCRGVLAETFTNNWVNGTLFMFPIQVDTIFDSKNQPVSKYPNGVVYFDKSTFNFYVRSSPYDISNGGEFVGLTPHPSTLPVNSRNLLFPTTIVDLGIKESFYAEIIFDPSANAYIMDKLDSTTYGDTSDLLNLFVISRITNQNTLRQFLSLGNNAISQLFSRGPGGNLDQRRKRVDGDLAQAISINSELGVIKFSPDAYQVPSCDSAYCATNACQYTLINNTYSTQPYSYYPKSGPVTFGNVPAGQEVTICADKGRGTIFSSQLTVQLNGCCDSFGNPVQLLGSVTSPVMAIWYSSSTEDLQVKDYLTPGRILFRNNNGNIFTYNYNIKSQTVPFYQWRLSTTTPIFGTEQNNWATQRTDFIVKPYQSLDRIPSAQAGNPGTPYFQSTTAKPNNSDNYRGYIFSVDANDNYSPIGAASNKFLVGAPFHFYFGIKRGSSALDHFRTKYIADE